VYKPKNSNKVYYTQKHVPNGVYRVVVCPDCGQVFGHVKTEGKSQLFFCLQEKEACSNCLKDAQHPKRPDGNAAFVNWPRRMARWDRTNIFPLWWTQFRGRWTFREEIVGPEEIRKQFSERGLKVVSNEGE
jgi:hypothetical protein